MNIKDTISDSLKVIDRAIPVHKGRRPEIGKSSESYQWQYTAEHYWTEAFWPGLLWLAYEYTECGKYLEAARKQSGAFKKMLSTPQWLHHDVGFLFLMSGVSNYRQTKDVEARTRALRAADILRSRFQWHGRYIQAWNPKKDMADWNRVAAGKMIIDSMENISLLYWATRESGDSSYSELATEHARAVQKHIVRDDYSTYHCFDFDPVSGEPMKGVTHQGWSDESCWSRGQAWAVHGFAQTYLNTGDEEFLQTACKLADYVLEHLPDDGVPPWDYLIPSDAPQVKDSSAGSITAAGIFTISQILSDKGDSRSVDYFNGAMKMLTGLRMNCDITAHPESVGLLNQGASHAKKGGYWANAMLPYGDYYYFEALLRAEGKKDFIWTACKTGEDNPWGY